MESERIDGKVVKIEKITRMTYGEIKAPLSKWSPKGFDNGLFSSESPKDCS